MDLPIPDGGIGLIDKHTFDDKNLINEENYGFCFYSIRVDKATLVKASIVNLISNKEDFFFNIII